VHDDLKFTIIYIIVQHRHNLNVKNLENIVANLNLQMLI